MKIMIETIINLNRKLGIHIYINMNANEMSAIYSKYTQNSYYKHKNKIEKEL